ncbi:hypothetical protein ACFC0M_00860 [Streptomyces sp. NPDC056149]|nr:hypothetical protein [Streptomyces sp. WZ-12]
MTDRYLATGVETVLPFPHNELGKVRKNVLRHRLTSTQPLSTTDS